VNAAIINIPADQQTIQDGINSAEAGDTILVAPGVYREEVNTVGRTLTVASTFITTGNRAMIDSTIIDGEGRRRCIITRNGEGEGSIFCGFTLQNGFATYGGGWYCYGSSPIVSDLVVRDCVAETAGGGIYITQNSSPQLTNITAVNDSAGRYGGGIGVYNESTPILDGITITGCEAGNYSGAFHISHAGPMTLRNFIFERNSAHFGSALGVISSEISFENGSICHNADGTDLLYSEAATINMSYLLIADNASTETHHLRLSGPTTLDHVTMVRNSDNVAAALYAASMWAGSVNVTNSIIRNSGQSALQIYEPEEPVTVSYSDIQGGRDAVQGSNRVTWGDGNIDADPLFVNPDNGDYHLTENSPCIDAGDPESDPDPDGTRADIGAFYFPQVRPPVLDHPIPDITIAEDCGAVMVADLDTVFSDVDGDSLWYAVFGVEELHLALNEDNLLWFEPALNFNGDSLAVEVRAYSGNDSTTAEFLVTVTPVNDPPTAFDLLSPVDSSYVICKGVIPFKWAKSFDPDSDSTVSYVFFIECREFGESYCTVVEADSLEYEILWDAGCTSVICNWWVRAISGEDTTECSERFTLDVQGTGAVGPDDGIPVEFAIQSISPNPFNNSTTIRFSLPASSSSLSVYGLDGRLMDGMDLGRLEAGEHAVVWNAEGLPGGVYLVRLESGKNVRTTKAILLR